MHKLVLISALLCLVSASARAGEHVRGLVLAASDAPAATTTETSTNDIRRPLPPVSKSDSKDDSKGDTGKKNDADRPQASTPADQRSGPKQPVQSRRQDSDEAKARRIAAKYGISW
jgi:hypothetical protein